MPDCSEIEGSKVLVGQVAVKRYSSFFSGLTDVLAEATHKLDALILPLVKALSTYIYAKEQKKNLCCTLLHDISVLSACGVTPTLAAQDVLVLR